MTLGETIRKYRTEAQMSMKQLGDKIGWTSPSVSDLERDKKSPPSIKTLMQISDVLKIDQSILIEKANDSIKVAKFDLSAMSPNKKELMLRIYQNWDSVTEADANSVLKFFK